MNLLKEASGLGFGLGKPRGRLFEPFGSLAAGLGGCVLCALELSLEPPRAVRCRCSVASYCVTGLGNARSIRLELADAVCQASALLAQAGLGLLGARRRRLKLPLQTGHLVLHSLFYCSLFAKDRLLLAF